MPAFEVYGPDGPVSREFDAVTADGVKVADGLRVWTNNLDRGTVRFAGMAPIYRPRYEWHPSYPVEQPVDFDRGVWWFDVETDNGGVTSQDGGRVATRWRGELA